MILSTPMLHVFNILPLRHSNGVPFNIISSYETFQLYLCLTYYSVQIYLHYYYISTVVKREITQSNDWSQRMLITYYWTVSWMSPKHFHSTRKLLRRLTASDSTTHPRSTTRRRFVDENLWQTWNMVYWQQDFRPQLISISMYLCQFDLSILACNSFVYNRMLFSFLNRKNQWSKVKTTLQGPGNQSKNAIGQNFDTKKNKIVPFFKLGISLCSQIT